MLHSSCSVDCEGAGLEVEEVGPDDVARKKIGRELDAPEVEREARSECLRKQRLGRTWRSFEKDMTAAEKRDQQEVEGLGLPHDRARDRLADGACKRFHLVNAHERSFPASGRAWPQPASDRPYGERARLLPKSR